MTYGLPYKGSKSKIAEWVVAHIPKAPVLVDIFAGGCAVTHAALLSGKAEYQRRSFLSRRNIWIGIKNRCGTSECNSRFV